MANIQSGAGGALSGAAAGTVIGGPIGAVAGGALGGLLGLFSGSGDDSYQKQLELLQQIQSEVDAIPLPELKELALERYRSAGVLTPEMEAVITQGPSRMEQVSIDPRLKQAQMGALTKLQQLGEEGLSPVEKAELNQLQRSVGQQEAAREQSILREMQQRGVGGAGAELAAKLSSSQAAANLQSQQADDLAAQAYKRALDSISQSGTLAGNIRTQDFGEQEKVASAADAIAKFNAANRQTVEGNNVSSKNRAQEMNLSNAQDIANRNVDVSNKEQQYNKELAQRQFENQMKKANAKTGAIGNQASYYGQQGQRDDQTGASVMSGLGTAAATIGDYYSPEKRLARKKAEAELNKY